MATIIYHASIDENKKTKGGKAGDQNGKEVLARGWYAHNPVWTAVYEPPTESIGMAISLAAKAGCDNDNIGYDQNQRNTLLTEAEKTGWSLGAIKTPCETDCSAFATVCVIAGGGATKSKMMNGSTNCPTSSNIGSRLKAAGWKEHTETKYTKSSEYLGPGWILVCAGHHVAINGTAGSRYSSKSCPFAEPTTTLTKGSKGTGVSWLQWHLNKLKELGLIAGFSDLEIDGSWGNATEKAFHIFWAKFPNTGTLKNNTYVYDGKCGSTSRKTLKNAVK